MFSKKINFLDEGSHKKTSNAAPVILSVLLLMAVGCVGYMYWQLGAYKKDLKNLSQQQSLVKPGVVKEEAEDLVQQVGKLLILPTNEQPTIATVTDIEKLRAQPFFKNAKTGDKVLIYTNAKKAILYDVLNNKVIEVAPLNIGGLEK